MKSPKKNKYHYINEIINIIKKHNISIDDIVKTYMEKYEMKFSPEDKIIHNNQYQNFMKYAILNDTNGKWECKYKIIDDYILLL